MIVIVVVIFLFYVFGFYVYILCICICILRFVELIFVGIFIKVYIIVLYIFDSKRIVEWFIWKVYILV